MTMPSANPSHTEHQPWDRYDSEPTIWYRRFRRYLRLKPPRSVLSLYNEERAERDKKQKIEHVPSSTYPHAWHTNVHKWQWRERAAAFDTAEQDRLDREWSDRRAAEKEREWEAANELYARALQMLKMPTVRSVLEDGSTIIQPAPPGYHRAAAFLISTARETARLAAGMITSRSALSLETLPDDELLRLYQSILAHESAEQPDRTNLQEPDREGT